MSLPAERVLLQAMLAAIEGEVPFRPVGVARDADMLALARRHRLSPLLATQIGPGDVSTALAEDLRRDRMATLARSTLLRHGLAEVLAAFGGVAVEVAVLKGISYEALLYPAAGTRPASDIDLLARWPQRRVAMATLTRLGFEPVPGGPGFDEPDYHEVSFRRDAVTVDLHFALAPLVRCRIDDETLWSGMQSWELAGRTTRTLGFIDGALNQALHMAIHHFDVPALYALDFLRLCRRATATPPARGAVVGAEGAGRSTAPVLASVLMSLRARARVWRIERPLETTLALVSALFPTFAAAFPGDQVIRPFSAEVTRGYGGVAPLSRARQLRRKLTHFDDPVTALRYAWVQGRRGLRERWITKAGGNPPAADRLGLA